MRKWIVKMRYYFKERIRLRINEINKRNIYNKQIVLLFIFFPLSSFSQLHISVNVLDSLTPLEFANVVLTNVDRQFVSGTITDQKGYFSIEASEGDYILEISFLGYNTFNKSIIINKSIKLGDILLFRGENSIEEVVVSVKRKVIERKIDRIIFNVNNSISSIGGNRLEVLNKAPGVRVNNENIGIIG